MLQIKNRDCNVVCRATQNAGLQMKWLREFKTPKNILQFNGNVKFTQPTLYPLPRFKFSDIKQLLESDLPSRKKTSIGETPYYLVIDEINRGNISKIFGELITLIEKDKRNTVSCKLPYSQKPFSLPQNLYIIGTMNTADRSIAILDVALRRRFYFKEIEPDANAITYENTNVMTQVNVAELLSKVNSKIVGKLDRDHRIGHSLFLGVHNISGLKLVWYYQIIPLLMEYFYNDADSIIQIIGDSFFEKNPFRTRWIDSDDDFKNAIANIK